MNIEQKKYIEKNIDLIENEDWHKFFLNAPPGIGAILYDSGVDFMSKMQKVPRRCFTKSDIKSITIPDSVTSIGYYAFYNCSSLISVTIGNIVTSISAYAFEGCSSLKTITFGGTMAQWEAIKKGYEWNYNTGDYTVHCTDGDITLN